MVEIQRGGGDFAGRAFVVPEGQRNLASHERRAVSTLCLHGNRIMQAP